MTIPQRIPRILLCLLLALALLCTGAGCAEDPPAASGDPSEASADLPSGQPSDISLPPFSEEESEEVSEAPDPFREDALAVLSPEDGTFACAKLFAWSSGSGLLLRKGEAEEQMYPASLTKLVTALVALEYADPDTECVAGDELDMVAKDASVAWIPKGSRATLGSLLEGMLLPSGCDASYVIAANVGRILNPETANSLTAVSDFVQEMNRWSKEHGLVHSNWMNPDGYHHNLHYTCLADMLRVGWMALQEPEILRCTRIGKETVRLLSGEGNTWTNTNHYVNPESSYYNPNCFGLKTGQTGEAGGCLLSAFQYGEEIVLIGVFGSRSNNARFDVTNDVLAYVGDRLHLETGAESLAPAA